MAKIEDSVLKSYYLNNYLEGQKKIEEEISKSSTSELVDDRLDRLIRAESTHKIFLEKYKDFLEKVEDRTLLLGR